MTTYHWIASHWPEILATWTLLNDWPRLLPDSAFTALERRWPRVVAILRVSRALGPSVAKAAPQIAAIWLGFRVDKKPQI